MYERSQIKKVVLVLSGNSLSSWLLTPMVRVVVV